MKLYNVNLSNFAAKCRIAIYEKQAPVEIVPLPGGALKSDEYLAIFPLGMVPALDTGYGIIGESQAINELVEEQYDGTALLPADTIAKAKVRFVCAIHDCQLESPFRATYSHVDPSKRDEALVKEKLAIVDAKLDVLETLAAGGDKNYFTGAQFTLADCALAPTCVFLEKFLPLLGHVPFTEKRPKLAQWWNYVQQRPAVEKALTEHRAAIKESFGI